jgi:hypothetical protein
MLLLLSSLYSLLLYFFDSADKNFSLRNRRTAPSREGHKVDRHTVEGHHIDVPHFYGYRQEALSLLSRIY